ncbi:MAG: DUF255 domain-containing protein [Bacteroidota bacterium]|nr:DUF255 domain-containing protein [Bacteroidota bacterium]MDX5448945.1 DUF255 domain-containing protein [Bacteroidota bacterium]
MKNWISILSLSLMSFWAIGQERIHWMTIEEAEQATQKEPRKILIDVYTDWCGWCKKMDQTTFQDPELVQYVNENYYAVKLDAEGRDSIRIKGHTFKYIPQGRRGYHELAAALLQGKMSYPTLVFLDEELRMIQPLPGFQTVTGLEPILKFFASNGYKDGDWETFQKNFKPEF